MIGVIGAGLVGSQVVESLMSHGYKLSSTTPTPQRRVGWQRDSLPALRLRPPRWSQCRRWRCSTPTSWCSHVRRHMPRRHASCSRPGSVWCRAVTILTTPWPCLISTQSPDKHVRRWWSVQQCPLVSRVSSCEPSPEDSMRLTRHTWPFTELPARPALNSITVRWLGSQLVGMMVIGCVARQVAAVSCAGFPTRSVRAIVTERNLPIPR